MKKKTIAKIPPTPRQIFRIYKDKRIKQMEKVKTFSIFPLTNGYIRIQYLKSSKKKKRQKRKKSDFFLFSKKKTLTFPQKIL